VTDPVLQLILFFLLFFLGGAPSLNKAQGSVVPNRIRIEYGRNVFPRKYALSDRRITSNMTSHFQDGGHDVISRLPIGALLTEKFFSSRFRIMFGVIGCIISKKNPLHTFPRNFPYETGKLPTCYGLCSLVSGGR